MRPPPGYDLGPAFSKDTTGVFCRGIQQKLARPVTLKFLHPRLKDNPRARAVFESERRLMGSLEHGNLLLTIDVGEVDGLPYVVTESIGQTSLAEVSRGGAVEEAQSVAIALGIARALHYLEARGLYYKNVRQHSVLLPRPDAPKLLTFRNVRTVAEAARFRGANVQSGAYCAPELVRDDLGPVTIKANVYALGVILFKLLAGEPPAVGTSAEVRAAHAQGTIRTLQEVRPYLRDRAHEVVGRLLAHNPSARANPAAAITLLEAYHDDPLVHRPLVSKKRRRRPRRRR